MARLKEDLRMREMLPLPATAPVLTGTRVILRPPVEHDIDDRLRYPIDPEEEDGYGGSWRRAWDGRRFHSRDDLAGRRTTPPHGQFDWSMEHLGECVGSTRLRVDAGNHRGTFSIGIFAPERRGVGLGQEATGAVVRWGFVELRLHRIELEVLASNDRAIGCYRACGFVHEGTRRQAELYPDGWHDFVVMGMLREDLPDDGAKPAGRRRRTRLPALWGGRRATANRS